MSSETVSDQAIYSRTVVRQFPYVRRSYDSDTTPFAIHNTWRTYDWRKYERKSATYLHRCVAFVVASRFYIPFLINRSAFVVDTLTF